VADPLVLARFAAGDEDAVRTIYRTYGRLVFAVAYKVLGDRALAEDATQQAFLQRLNIPVGTVKSRSFRVHRRLAGLLGHLRGDDPAGSAPSQARIGTGGQR
jgi:DNA-directed RNA polymerase specialized sigma24 family protein